MKIKKIEICNRHDKEVSLIWTFAFNGYECWCPYCGAKWDLFGTGKEVEETLKLKKEAKIWKEKTEEYLNACKTLVCSTVEWKGKRIKPSELPEEEINRRKKIIIEWKYEINSEK